MRNLLLFAIVLLAGFASCKNNSSQTDGKFVIEGTVDDTTCEGAKIFLVPLMEPATHETVDSVVIKDGKFHFEGTKCRVASIRMQMPQRMMVQELLVYTEPGTIKALVSKHGSVTGTKNNNLLDQYKQSIEKCMLAIHAIRSGHSPKDPAVKSLVDSVNSVRRDAAYKLIKESGYNDLSCYLYMGNRYFFTDQQRSEFPDLEKYYQHQVDSIKKVNAQNASQQNVAK